MRKRKNKKKMKNPNESWGDGKDISTKPWFKRARRGSRIF